MYIKQHMINNFVVNFIKFVMSEVYVRMFGVNHVSIVHAILKVVN